MKFLQLAIYLSVAVFPWSALLADENDGRKDSTPATTESAIEWALPFVSDHFAEATLVDFNQAGEGRIVLERLSEEWFEPEKLPIAELKYLERYLVLRDLQWLRPSYMNDQVYVLQYKAKPTQEHIDALSQHFHLPDAWAPKVEGRNVFVGHPDRVAQLLRREGGKGELAKAMQAAGPAAVIWTYHTNPSARKKLRDDIQLAKRTESKKVHWLEIKRELSWMQLSLTLQPQFQVKLRLQAESDTAADAAEADLAGRLACLQKTAKPIESAPPEAWEVPVFNAKIKMIRVGKVTRENRLITLESELSPEQTAAAYQELSTSFSQLDQRVERTATMKLAGMGILLFVDGEAERFPRDICDANGKPLMSWRVSLLPVMDYGKTLVDVPKSKRRVDQRTPPAEIYKQLRLDEPWDSPHNAPLLKQIDPRMFASNPKTPDGHADTLRVLGKGFGFVHSDPQKMVMIQDITDGTHYTPMLVEVSPEQSVPWAKPADYEWDSKKPTAGLGREGETYFDAVFGDTVVRKISKDESADTLRKLFGRANGLPDELKEPWY